jgi:hypothetical protein
MERREKIACIQLDSFFSVVMPEAAHIEVRGLLRHRARCPPLDWQVGSCRQHLQWRLTLPASTAYTIPHVSSRQLQQLG